MLCCCLQGKGRSAEKQKERKSLGKETDREVLLIVPTVAYMYNLLLYDELIVILWQIIMLKTLYYNL